MASEVTTSVDGTALYLSDGAGVATRVSSTNPVPTSGSAPLAANILNGFRADTGTVGATTILTIPAGRTWQGTITISATCSTVAASTTVGRAQGLFSIAGAGATPAAGSIFQVDARNGANAATGTSGVGAANFGSTPVTIIAPVGNAVTLQAASLISGTNSDVAFSAFGSLV